MKGQCPLEKVTLTRARRMGEEWGSRRCRQVPEHPIGAGLLFSPRATEIDRQSVLTVSRLPSEGDSVVVLVGILEAPPTTAAEGTYVCREAVCVCG